MNERNWGGKRKGAGRKKGNTVYKTISVSLPEDELEILQETAERQNMTVSRFISKYFGLDTAAPIISTGFLIEFLQEVQRWSVCL